MARAIILASIPPLPNDARQPTSTNRRLVANSPEPTGTPKADINPMSKPSNWAWLNATQPIAPATTNVTPSHLRSGYGLRNRSSRKARATTMTVWVISDDFIGHSPQLSAVGFAPTASARRDNRDSMSDGRQRIVCSRGGHPNYVALLVFFLVSLFDAVRNFIFKVVIAGVFAVFVAQATIVEYYKVLTEAFTLTRTWHLEKNLPPAVIKVRQGVSFFGS